MPDIGDVADNCNKIMMMADEDILNLFMEHFQKRWNYKNITSFNITKKAGS